MGTYVPSVELIARIQAGEPAAIGRLMSRAESGTPEARETLVRIHKLAGRAHIVGITGVPGSGKSTLVGKLAQNLRVNGDKVGIIAIDPSSPYSGGSILGDRIRMSDIGTDPGIYIRSMATHGATGGMAHAALEVVDILDAAGFGIIILETVGVGQDEVEIARASHTTVVVSAPGLGDDIQAIKAGILEIADIHVVSKCDRSDANRTLNDLQQMLMLETREHKPVGWAVPVIGTSAVTEEGLDELLDAIARHRDVTLNSDTGHLRRKSIAEFRLRKTAEKLLYDRFAGATETASAQLTERLMRRESDPYSLAEELLAATLKQEEDDERDVHSRIA
ncbi:MAG: methylmalonyl Co-A mutase-associated GTPase MeaB [Arenicellales bacterium]|jgi:LAO/AO transport system kinase|nr:methylmalonyl Co-A mutase-associated GTPase MeaB [Arenicellales bacterium]MDP6854057.1 methylmalonyl Co-A mutase-associated GTPase MeaB [Arenicellales bacterium]|tara:strand:- start:2939 stop:3943 length:1005 start_codon:yes stop_codon:yes gene_type:complete